MSYQPNPYRRGAFQAEVVNTAIKGASNGGGVNGAAAAVTALVTAKAAAVTSVAVAAAPVVATAAVVGAAGYGIYKLVKYLEE